jgi:hypothetical protein
VRECVDERFYLLFDERNKDRWLREKVMRERERYYTRMNAQVIFPSPPLPSPPLTSKLKWRRKRIKRFAKVVWSTTVILLFTNGNKILLFSVIICRVVLGFGGFVVLDREEEKKRRSKRRGKK